MASTTAITDLTNIMGVSEASEYQLQTYLNNINADAPDYASIYLAEGSMEGVRGDIAFAQSCLETGNFTFGGDVSADQNNFAGLGATGNGVSGLSFDTPQIGIRAQIQHLKAYATDADLTNECVDPRFGYVTRACAPFVEWLGTSNNPYGKGWASDSSSEVKYGDSILRILSAILEIEEPVNEDDVVVESTENTTSSEDTTSYTETSESDATVASSDSASYSTNLNSEVSMFKTDTTTEQQSFFEHAVEAIKEKSNTIINLITQK